MTNLRRTMMFVPGNHPAMIRDASIYASDSIMFDLEDAVSPFEKDSARLLVYHALKMVDYGEKELIVRINSLNSGFGFDDIEAMIAADVDVIRLPKTETAKDIKDVEEVIESYERKLGREVGSTKMMAAIESAKGTLNALEIAESSKRLIGIALGAEDYVTNMKTRRYPNGNELLFARSMIIHAARSVGIMAFDTIYTDLDNEEGFKAEVELIHQLGFDGKSIINPRQIKIVNEIYRPTKKEINHALDVINAIEEANEKKSGVIALNGKMIDKPIVERAKYVLSLANHS
ncbi:citrate (pro-3S)-lyase subunit beta [Amphibacillus cookii]|uniref:citrate (pro-3S)-lyase subunit beta n=1 Tax=Amphibacillus cookii TaxID=767787 RepID=UPI001959C237|nr:citrate (pro-3S)-lyase subunit beta [Amphibacillus cookii]MBM7540201.1 citrate lyase subunit beta/citryl-CoA lyase [Amphibacillus cookii]